MSYGEESIHFFINTFFLFLFKVILGQSLLPAAAEQNITAAMKVIHPFDLMNECNKNCKQMNVCFRI